MDPKPIIIDNVPLWPPDPLPRTDSGDPDTASFVPVLISLWESTRQRKMSDAQKVDLENQARSLYGLQSNYGELGGSDTVQATGGGTITDGEFSWSDFLGDWHDNAEIISQERIGQGVELVTDGVRNVGEWAGGVIASPIKGFAAELFNVKTLTILGVGLAGLYFVTQIKPKAL